jgi:hypothetical protein
VSFAASTEPYIGDIDFGELSIRLAKYFAGRVGPADVDDLVQETLVRVLDSIGSRWDPERGSIAQFAFGVIARDVLLEYRRRVKRHVPLTLAREPTVDPPVPSMAIRRVQALARGDPLVSLLLDRETGSDDRIGLLLRALDPSPTELHNARRRLARIVRRASRG